MVVMCIRVRPVCRGFAIYRYSLCSFRMVCSENRNANGVSIVQGGSGYPYFAPSTFSYISGEDTCSIVATQDEIPDPEVEEALQKVINMAAVWSVTINVVFVSDHICGR
jgi:hypothetical protein